MMCAVNLTKDNPQSILSNRMSVQNDRMQTEQNKKHCCCLYTDVGSVTMKGRIN